jgi:hypothetical protein
MLLFKARLDVKHGRQLLCRFDLSDAAEICSEADHVAAARAVDCKVGPTTSANIDAERAWPMIDAARVECRVFGAPEPSIGEPSFQEPR